MEGDFIVCYMQTGWEKQKCLVFFLREKKDIMLQNAFIYTINPHSYVLVVVDLYELF